MSEGFSVQLGLATSSVSWRNRGGLSFPLSWSTDFRATHPSSGPERTFGWLPGFEVKNSDPWGSRAACGFPPKQASAAHSRSAELSELRGNDSLSTAWTDVLICGAAAVSMTEPDGSLARSKVSYWSCGRPKSATPRIVKRAPLTLRLREAQMESLSFGRQLSGLESAKQKRSVSAAA